MDTAGLHRLVPVVRQPERARGGATRTIGWQPVGELDCHRPRAGNRLLFGRALLLRNLITDQPSPYAGLNAYLSSVHAAYPLGSTLTKEYLWDIYQGGYDIPGGISAMPSMHNAQATLFAAAGYRVSRRLGHVMLAYAAIIFVGSIHLGWHYAIDGIAGALLALFIWWIAGMVVKRSHIAGVGLS